MRTAIIAEKSEEGFDKLANAFKARVLEPQFIEVGNSGMLVEKNEPSFFLGNHLVSGLEAAFLSLPPEFAVFAEPLLSGFADSGVYCQLKPSSFYVVSNKPFMYATLNSKGVRVPKTDVLGDKELADGAIKSFEFPLMVKTFLGLKKTNSILVESERTLVSMVKSITQRVDAITIQEYIEGDLDQSLVIGDEVLTVKRKWVEKELSHSKKASSTKLSGEDAEMAVKAARVCGMDIGIVKMVHGMVIGVRSQIDFGTFNSALGASTQDRIAAYFEEKLKA